MTNQVIKPHRIIIIREEEEQMTGSSCCGAFSGDFKEIGGEVIYEERREIILSTGSLYRSIISEYDQEAEIDIIDARNQLYLIPRLIRDTVKYRVPLIQSLRTIFGFRLPSIICDGQLIAAGKLDSESAFQKISAIIQKSVPHN